MLKQLQLIHFQSHVDTVVTFHPGVNIISGMSDSGKSALLRALRWVVFNRPLGTAFRSHWAGKFETKVGVETIEGKNVTRFRGNTTNGYLLGEDELTASGTEPPSDISEALNLTEDNFQGQLDSPYLLTLNGGQVAKELNGIAHLEVIDRGLGACRKGILEAGRDIQRLEGDVQSLEGELEGFEGLDMIVSRRDYLQVMVEDKQELSRMIPEIKMVLEILAKGEESLKARDKVTSAKNKLDSLERLRKSLEEKKGEREALADTLDSLLRAQKQSQVIGDWEGARARLDAQYDRRAKYQELEKEKGSLYALLQSLGASRTLLTDRTSERDSLTTELEVEKKKAPAKFICPTCKRPL